MSDISGLGEFFCHACTLPGNVEELRRKYFALSEFERRRLREVRAALDAVLRPVEDAAPVPLTDILYARARPCFTCDRMIDEATLAGGQIVTLDGDRVRHKLRCTNP